MAQAPGEPDLIYGIDDVPPPVEGMVLGLQHYLTMFGSTVAIPLLLAGPLGIAGPEHRDQLGMLIGTMFFVSGITTLLQTTLGNRLPIIQGGTFSFISPAFAICGMALVKDQGFEVKMQHLQGAIIAGAAFEIVIGYSGLIGKLRRFIGPITIAPTIALIGLALFPFGAPKAGTHWGIGGLTIFLIILFSQVLRRRHRFFELFPILLAIVGAWGVAAICSGAGVFAPAVTDAAGELVTAAHPAYTSFQAVADAPWIRVPYPFQWGMPQFAFPAIVGMLAGFAASMIESIGDYYACARLSGAPIPTEKTINKGIGMEGIGCAIAGVFGTGNGTTSYSENIGAIGLTRVGSRRVVQYGAVLMIILGAVAKFGALFTSIPDPIVGGMYCALFGMIASVGLSNLQFVDLNSVRNLFIMGFAFFMGLSVPFYFFGMSAPVPFPGSPLTFDPKWLAGIVQTIGTTGMAVGALIACVLDNLIPGTDEERGLTAWMSPAPADPAPEERE